MTTAIPEDLLSRLKEHRALHKAPQQEHEWLLQHGKLERLAVGDVLTGKGELSEAMYVVFSGHLVIRVDRGVGAHKVFEWRAGDVGGVLPFSRGARPPNDVVAEQPTEVLSVKPECFPDLIRECPSVTATLVHQMLDRARQFNANDMRDEKLVSLGRLAAGLAHELNNPASAAMRSAQRLADSVVEAERAAMAVGEARLTPEQMTAIREVLFLTSTSEHPVLRSAVQRADHEDAIADWLASHGASEACAAPLAEVGVSISALDRLADVLSGKVLDDALCWLSSGVAVRTLAAEIESATSRIHDLVSSVKRFTFMDHAPTPEPVDIRRGITDTVVMLGNKIRHTNANVTLDLPEDLPRAYAVGAELNQVWMNILENALDAIAPGGNVSLRASHVMNNVVVRIADDGPGIPQEIVGRIFEPFFTTKEVGKGTGMGLEIVRRIIRRHEGSIDVESRPGHTEFRVTLPVEA